MRPMRVGRAALVPLALVVAVTGVAWSSTAAAPVEVVAGGARAVAVPATVSRLVCPPPPVPAAGAAGTAAEATDPEFAAAPVATITSLRAVAAPGTASSVSGATLTDPVRAATFDGLVLAATGAVTSAVEASPAGQAAVPLAALHTALTTAGDVRGLAASGCAAPAPVTWLVGGSTEVGRSLRLVLGNPGSSVSTVDVVVLTSTGAVQPPAAQGLSLAPGEQQEVLVEGLVPAQGSVAVGVTSHGGPAAALLVDARLDGLVPAGVDVVSPGTPPATRQVVPGVDAGPASRATLRVAVPGARSATVTWTVHGPAGPVTTGPATRTVTVPAGTAVDVELGDLEPGGPGPGGSGAAPVGVVVESTEPVLASVAVQRATGSGAGGPSPSDIAWASASGALAGRSVVVLPAAGSGIDATAAVTAPGPGGAELEVVELAADGTRSARRHVSVVAGTTAVVPVSASAAALLLRPRSGVAHAGIVLRASSGVADRDLVASVAVPPPPAATEVRVAGPTPGTWPAP